jgi:hypothetical protein
VAFFAFDGAETYYGTPALGPGVRVRFDPGKLVAAARERDYGRPVDRPVAGDAGLVVHEVATDVIRWPSSLWRVDKLDRPVRLRPGTTWVRCQAFDVLEQVPEWLVAGPHGDAVEWVITRARVLTGDQVDALATLRDDGEEQLTRTLWDLWMRAHREGSPVGCGLLELHRAVDEAARRVGPRLFGWDEEDGVEVLRDPGWQRARSAAHGAALALGAPQLLSAEHTGSSPAGGRACSDHLTCPGAEHTERIRRRIEATSTPSRRAERSRPYFAGFMARIRIERATGRGFLNTKSFSWATPRNLGGRRGGFRCMVQTTSVAPWRRSGAWRGVSWCARPPSFLCGLRGAFSWSS